MILGRALAVAVCLAAPASARAESVRLPCALPVGQRFVFTLTQHGWTRAGAPSDVVLRRALRFEQDGAGVALLLGPAQATSNLGGAEQRRLAAMYRPDLEREARLHLDAQGRVVALDDPETHWRAYLARLERLRALAQAEGEPTDRTSAMLAALARADDAAKLAATAGTVEPLLRFCGQAVDAMVDAAADIASVTESTASADVTQQAVYRIARASGLVLSIERRVAIRAQPDRPLAESWRLDPAK